MRILAECEQCQCHVGDVGVARRRVHARLAILLWNRLNKGVFTLVMARGDVRKKALDQVSRSKPVEKYTTGKTH